VFVSGGAGRVYVFDVATAKARHLPVPDAAVGISCANLIVFFCIQGFGMHPGGGDASRGLECM
jgi:hypothetical protein